jgi:predicted nucleic acid-binding protein
MRTWDLTAEFLDLVRGQTTVVPLTIETHELALEMAFRHQLGIYDGMIVAAALLADCDTLYSEDMHDGLLVDGRLTIVNPFRDV